MKPFSSLFTRILLWFFMNMALVAAALLVFFAFQSQVDLHAVFGHQTSDRLRVAGRLISHDLNHTPASQWPDVLARHGALNQVDFVLVFANGSRFSAKDLAIPDEVLQKVAASNRVMPAPARGLLLESHHDSDEEREEHHDDDTEELPDSRVLHTHHEGEDRPYQRLMIHTKNPSLYWAGIPIPVSQDSMRPPANAMLLAVSDSVTGNGFFFDPLPWMIVAIAVIAISVLLWVPLVRNITGPLTRMTRAAEEVAKGRLDVRINEPRTDEIGRLASAINHMTSRLGGYVKGQKRFLGDVAHELGSPIARIQLGLGILEQRLEGDNRARAIDVLEDVAHMSNLVHELLSFSRAEMNPARIRLESTELLPLVQGAVQREGAPGAEIVVQIESGITVVAAPSLLTRAIANLVRNSVRYTGKAGPIYITAERKNDAVTFEIKDSGPGVPEELMERIFEPFFRTEPSRDRDTGGVGLGLAIVKTCVEACKGTVSARNMKPAGFAVSITLKAGNPHPEFC
ncbi:MAG: HAMP domain-containing histidine kinase [Proteobacteria bacterium]|nr:HAMP domain-containing histidine kinase [Pseudomonadota bacterium]